MIIIDPGHGGTDPGAVNGDMKEKDYNLLISNYMYERFNDLGIPAYITRTTDETLSPTDRINRITPNITSSDDIVISNHLNAGGAASMHDDEINPFISSQLLFLYDAVRLINCLSASHQ